MANLSAFISEMAAVTGVKVESLASFIETNKAIEIPDEVVNGIKGGILTIEAAKNNSVLHDHFNAVVRNGIDTDMERLMSELKLDEPTIAELKAEKKTAPRIRLLANKIKDLEAAKIQATGGDKKVLQEKIDALTQQVTEANAAALKQKEELEIKVKEAEIAFFNQLRGYKENEHFQSYQYAGDQKVHPAQAKLAKILTDEKLKELGLKTVFDKETGQVKLLTNTDTIYYRDNKPVDFKGFTDGLLAENHLLKVSEPAKTGGGNQQVITTVNGEGKIKNDMFMAAINKAATTPLAQTN